MHSKIVTDRLIVPEVSLQTNCRKPNVILMSLIVIYIIYIIDYKHNPEVLISLIDQLEFLFGFQLLVDFFGRFFWELGTKCKSCIIISHNILKGKIFKNTCIAAF